MDISQIEKDEIKRQFLIREQLGDGYYNKTTGVYKYGDNIYDLTKTNGEGGLGYPSIKGRIINYKTMHENKVMINPPSLQEEIFTLERFTPLSNSEMLEDIEGEYVLFSSVLNLFSAKNK